jgi:hypothetical protein
LVKGKGGICIWKVIIGNWKSVIRNWLLEIGRWKRGNRKIKNEK